MSSVEYAMLVVEGWEGQQLVSSAQSIDKIKPRTLTILIKGETHLKTQFNTFRARNTGKVCWAI